MTTPATAEVAKVRREASSITSPVLNTAEVITIVDSDSYALADSTLGRIREAKRKVTEKFDPIIKPIFNSLALLYRFRKELEDPLGAAESQLKGKMALWQASERKRIFKENEARQAETYRLRRQLEEKTAKAEKATRPSVKTALSNATTELAQKLTEVESAPEATVAKGQHSNTRTIRTCTVMDLRAFLKAVLEGEIPIDCIREDAAVIRAYFKDSPATVAKWPGLKITEDVQIVGR